MGWTRKDLLEIRCLEPGEIQTILDGISVRAEWAIDPENAAGKVFRANGYPTMVVIGKTGKIEAINSGNMADLETRVRTQLDSLLTQPPSPPSSQPAVERAEARAR